MSEQKTLQQIQDTLHDGLLLYSTDMKVATINVAAKNLLGIKRDIIGLPWETVLKTDVKKYCRYELIRHFDPAKFLDAAVKQGKTSTGEAVLTSKPPKTVAITVAPVYDEQGKLSGVLSHVRDISRQKELEKAQNEFVATASHELRSPITAIVGYLSMLRNGDAGPVTNKQQALFVEKAYQNSKRMVGLIEDLLMTTRMEAGQIRYDQTPVALSELVETVLSDVSFKALDKGVAIHCQRKDCGVVIADRDCLLQVLNNLVNNAINYTQPGGTVTIRFRRALERGKPRQVITVQDTGVGIDRHDLHKIFNKFARLDNPLSVSAGGTGLGLYITKSIVEGLKGKIWVESAKGQGATFHVSLPGGSIN